MAQTALPKRPRSSRCNDRVASRRTEVIKSIVSRSVSLWRPYRIGKAAIGTPCSPMIPGQSPVSLCDGLDVERLGPTTWAIGLRLEDTLSVGRALDASKSCLREEQGQC